MNNVITSSGFAVALSFMTVAVALAAVGMSLARVVDAVRAIRAKNRAKYYLLERAPMDAELRAWVGHHRNHHEMSSEELEMRLRKIEREISNHLSKTDQDFVKQGLHQHSQQGARRYVDDVLSAA